MLHGGRCPSPPRLSRRAPASDRGWSHLPVAATSFLWLTLALLVAWVRADDHDSAMSPDDTSFVADFLDARLDLHGVPHSSRTLETRASHRNGEQPERSLVAVDDAAPGQVIGRELYDDPIFRQDADVVLPHLAANVRQDLVAIGELHPEHRVREWLDHSALDLDGPVFLRHVLRYLTSGLVIGTQHPFRDRRLLRSRASRGSGPPQKRMQGTPEWTLCADIPVYARVPVRPNWPARAADGGRQR